MSQRSPKHHCSCLVLWELAVSHVRCLLTMKYLGSSCGALTGTSPWHGLILDKPCEKTAESLRPWLTWRFEHSKKKRASPLCLLIFFFLLKQGLSIASNSQSSWLSLPRVQPQWAWILFILFTLSWAMAVAECGLCSSSLVSIMSDELSVTTIWAPQWAIWLCPLISEVKLTSWKTATTDFYVLTRKRFRV